jgi:hypothetical protein
VAGTAGLVPATAGGASRAARSSRRRKWAWVAFLGFSPLCLGVVSWAALSWNGSYPTVAPPVPRGWQPVAGVYASFSAPKSWSLSQSSSDTNGDTYYSGPGGGAGESVAQVTSRPSPAGIPVVVATYLGGHPIVESRTPVALHNATAAWRYTFRLSRGAGAGTAIGVMAWVRATQSEVWLVSAPASRTAEKILSTLTLAR